MRNTINVPTCSILTFCFGARGPRTYGAVRLAAHRRNRSLGVCRTGPSGPAARVRPGARRPWRPSRPRRPACRGNAQRRNPGCLSSCDPGECRRRLPGRTSRKRVSASRASSGTWGCPLLRKSCRRHWVEAYRNSWRSTWGLQLNWRTVKSSTVIATNTQWSNSQGITFGLVPVALQIEAETRVIFSTQQIRDSAPSPRRSLLLAYHEPPQTSKSKKELPPLLDGWKTTKLCISASNWQVLATAFIKGSWKKVNFLGK